MPGLSPGASFDVGRVEWGVRMTGYVLALSDEEVARYRFMAKRAAEDEADQWAVAGIVAGAVIADVGCGPGAVRCGHSRTGWTYGQGACR
jgi:hypothetical protein